MSKKVGLAPCYPKNEVLTPKSHSPANEVSKTRKLSKNSKCTKSRYKILFNHIFANANIINLESSRNSQIRVQTKLDTKAPS